MYFRADHDVAVDPADDEANGSVAGASFTKKLYDILDKTDDEEIVCWSPDGLSFEVKDPKRLELEILPKFFRHGRFQSFVRQLNFYSFKKVTKERSSWVYSHEFFRRKRPDLLEHLKRKTNSGVLAEEVVAGEKRAALLDGSGYQSNGSNKKLSRREQPDYRLGSGGGGGSGSGPRGGLKAGYPAGVYMGGGGFHPQFPGGYQQHQQHHQHHEQQQQHAPSRGTETLHYMLGRGGDPSHHYSYPPQHQGHHHQVHHTTAAPSSHDGNATGGAAAPKKPVQLSQPHFSVSQLAHHGLNMSMSVQQQPMAMNVHAHQQYYRQQQQQGGYHGLGGISQQLHPQQHSQQHDLRSQDGFVPPLVSFHSGMKIDEGAHLSSHPLSSQLPRQTSFCTVPGTDDEASVSSVNQRTVSPRNLPSKQQKLHQQQHDYSIHASQQAVVVRQPVHRMDYDPTVHKVAVGFAPTEEDAKEVGTCPSSLSSSSSLSASASVLPRRPRSESFSQNQCSFKLDDPITAAEHTIVNFCMQRNPWNTATLLSDVRSVLEHTPLLSDELADYHEALSPDASKTYHFSSSSSSSLSPHSSRGGGVGGGGLRSVHNSSSMSLSDNTDASSLGDDGSSVQSDSESVYEQDTLLEPGQRLLRLRNADLMRTFMTFATKTLQSISFSLKEQQQRRRRRSPSSASASAAAVVKHSKNIDIGTDSDGTEDDDDSPAAVAEFVRALGVCTETWWSFASVKYL